MDPRQERSRASITTSFDELLAEKGYDSITVADIIERAHVGRATFYAHFRNKDELLANQIAEICEHALNPTTPEHHHDFEGKTDPLSQVEHILCHLLERRQGLAALIAGSGSEPFANALRHEIVARAEATMPARPQGPAAEMNRSFLAHHIAASFVGMVRWWAWHDFEATPHELAQSYLACILPLFGREA